MTAYMLYGISFSTGIPNDLVAQRTTTIIAVHIVDITLFSSTFRGIDLGLWASMIYPMCEFCALLLYSTSAQKATNANDYSNDYAY